MKTPALHTETHAHCKIRIVTDDSPSNPREDDNLGTMVCWHGRYTLGDEQPSHDAAEHKLKLLRDAGEDAFVDGLEARYEAITLRLDRENTGPNPIRYGGDAYCRLFEEAAKPILAERDALLAKHYTILPLYLYDHSGITMSTGRFSCAWDSGKVGFVYCSLKQARSEYASALAKANTDLGWETVIPWGEGKTATLREAVSEVMTQEVKTYDQFLTGEVYGYTVTHNETGKEDSCWGFFQNENPDAKDSYVLAQAREAAESLDVDAAKEREERLHWECRDTVTVG